MPLDEVAVAAEHDAAELSGLQRFTEAKLRLDLHAEADAEPPRGRRIGRIEGRRFLAHHLQEEMRLLTELRDGGNAETLEERVDDALRIEGAQPGAQLGHRVE